MTNENAKNGLSDIVLVNADFEKVAAEKKAILEENSRADIINERIERKRRTNFVLAFLFGFLFAGGAGAFFWLTTESPFLGLTLLTTKITLTAIGAVSMFGIVEGLSLIRSQRLSRKKRTIQPISEYINFVTFAKGKTIEGFSAPNYNLEPCTFQRVYVTFFMNCQDRETEYTSTEKWNLVLLPSIFYVIVDAKNTTLYVPCELNEDNKQVKVSLGDRLKEERLAIEKEARVRAESDLANALAEKEAIERVLNKRENDVQELQQSLEAANATVKDVELKIEEEKKPLLLLIETAKTEISKLQASLDEANKFLEEKSKIETQLRTENETLVVAAETAIAERNSAREQQEAKISELKESFLTAAKNAKDTLVKTHNEEVSRLKDEIARLSAENDKAEVVAELSKVKSALEKETTARTLKERENSLFKEQISQLEEKIEAQKASEQALVNSHEAEKKQLLDKIEIQEDMINKAKEAKESLAASSSMQERALLKEKETLSEKVKEYEEHLKRLYPLQQENEDLKAELASAKNENLDEIKKEYEEKISLAREEQQKMEKKMREALEDAAKEKADRIKSENALKKYLEERKLNEKEKQEAAHEEQMARAREAAEKAKQDAMNGQAGAEEDGGKKRPQRRLNI